jgi:glutamyl-tRNA synthetase
MNQVVTRFPPSPTGSLHVGGARTALFNWLYARRMKGRFILRIEDTDTERSTQASVDAIFEALEWLGLDWDEGPHYQTQRFAVYREHVQKLLDSGHAYHCTCPPEAVERMRQAAMASGGKPKYDGTCRHKKQAPSEKAVVRFKAPLSGTTVLADVIKGDIVFKNEELDDFVICRSDGSPTYNFAVVVDDITMGVNTIIRGDDHVMNTPKQIQLYRAFGAALPLFGHVPMVLGKDRTRLSKRHGATSVTAYRDMGYLPEALINYLVRLGWSHGDQEFFTRGELIEVFNLENIGRAAGVFDVEKLMALNADHIKAAAPSRLAAPLAGFMREKGIEIEGDPRAEKVIASLSARSKTLREMAEQAVFYFDEEIAYDPDAARKFLTLEALPSLTLLIAALETLGDFSEQAVEQVFHGLVEKTGLKLGKIAQPVRVALSGRAASPGIYEIMAIIGRERVLARLRKAIAHIESRGG